MAESHPDWVERHFAPADLEAIRAAVAAAERQTAAEIRVHLERRAVGDVLAHARRVFHALGMHRTRHRASVLLYLAVDDRKFAIVGDDGIHAQVGYRLWDSVRDVLQRELRAGRMRDGVTAAVAEIGRALGAHFPPRPDDPKDPAQAVTTA
jgi:uncharacterized membrane protein